MVQPSNLPRNAIFARSFGRHPDVISLPSSVTIRNAFLDFNLAPLELRRDIGMLGALWKIAHGTAHKLLQEMFPMCDFKPALQNTRGASRRHRLRFVDRCIGDQLVQFSRSLFGLVRVWNDLPAHIVEINDVKTFRSRLTACSRNACRENADGWASMYSTDSFPRLLIRHYYDS